MALLIWIHSPPTTLSAAALKDLSPAQLEVENLVSLRHCGVTIAADTTLAL